MLNDPTLLGNVQDVNGPTVSVALSSETSSGFVYIKGHGYRIGQLGSFVRIPIGYIDLYGIVSKVGASATPEKVIEAGAQGYRWMTVQMVGEGTRTGVFQRGISQYPTVGDQVHLVTEQDLTRIYGHPDKPNFVKIGHLASAESIPALIDIDKLITRHSAVVGATGAGKSTTVAGLLVSLSEKADYPSARIIIIDIHGEYAAALKDRASVFRINPNESNNEKPLYIPYWAMGFDELLPITFGTLDDIGRGYVLEKIMELKRVALQDQPRSGVSETNLTVDTPVPFSIHQLWFDLYCEIRATHIGATGTNQSRDTWALVTDGNGDPVESGDAMAVIPPEFRGAKNVSGDPEKIYLSNSTLNIRRPLEGLASRLRDPRFDFLFRPGPWHPNSDGQPLEDLDSLLQLWVGGDEPITILDLSGVPPSILKDLVGVLLRIIYDALFWARNLSDGSRERPLLVVLEEAHAYLSTADLGSAASAVRRIVKEGRKYGIGAMIVSQRPSEIDSTILSQCGSIIAMRLSNTTDRGHVTNMVTDNLEGLLSMLPSLRTGEAIIVGEAVNIPVRTQIDPPPINRRPDSGDPVVFNIKGPGGWNREKELSDYSEVVTVWRRQEPRSPRIVEKTKEMVNMDRVLVESSNLVSVGYNSELQILEIEFGNSNVYQYFDVPEFVHQQLMSAPSKGQYLSSEIKGHYRYAKV